VTIHLTSPLAFPWLTIAQLRSQAGFSPKCPQRGISRRRLAWESDDSSLARGVGATSYLASALQARGAGGCPSPTLLCYHGSIMKKREGVTAKISISLSRSALASLKRRAKRLYAGNVSAVISELAADAALLEGMHELVSWLGGPSLTDRERKEIDREWSERAHAPKRVRRNRAA
jgi:hypothetical protein